MKINPPLLALAIGAFGIGVTEFTPMGLLPVMAADLGVSIPTAGLLVSAYALGVLIGAPLMTLTTGRMSRKTLLIGLAAIFTLGNFLSAIADSYALLLVSRIVTSLNHGAFFGVGAVVAAGLVPVERQASAVAAMFTGLTVATIAGVPLATWIGQHLGWRAAFWGTTGLGVVTMAALWASLPAALPNASGNARSELSVLKRGNVLLALALTAIGFSAMFALFTFVTPILQGEAGASPLAVTLILMIFGVGLAIGNWAGGRFADRSVDRTLIVAMAAQILLLLVFPFVMQSAIAAAALLFAIGIASFALVPPLQMRVMNAAADAPNLASAMNIGAFNLGNAIGAAAGSGVIGLGLGYGAVSIAAALMAAAGLTLVLFTRRRPARGAPAGLAQPG
ncbi:MFS transporter [Sphingomonas sp. HF-S3]|uniref:MFS transporter n=1 Tax=Sphingomonas rustica TaxID=3103142 RepID=A0ABV0B7Q9_9SPHN